MFPDSWCANSLRQLEIIQPGQGVKGARILCRIKKRVPQKPVSVWIIYSWGSVTKIPFTNSFSIT